MKTKKFMTYFVLLYMFSLNNSTIYASNIEVTTEKSSETAIESTTEENKNKVDENGVPILVAESAILIDANTGVILYDKDCHRRLYPASITKIMTTMLAVEYGKYDEIVTHSHEAIYGIGPGSSHIGMREDEQITFEQALYGIMLESANEVCMAVAEHIDENVDKFVERMNKKAKEVGTLDTHFANPHGFHDDNHYTTAYDMAQIMKAAITHEDFIKITSTLSYTIPPTNIVNESRPLNNKNKMIQPWSQYYYENCIGGKTGFTDEAGNTLVTYGKKDDMSLISVVMKDQGTNIYTDSKALLEYGFKMYEKKELFNSKDYSGTLNVIQKYKDKILDLDNIKLHAQADFNEIVPKFIDKKDIIQKINIPENISAPVKKGDTIGNIELVYNNITIGDIKIISDGQVDAISQETLIENEKREVFIQKLLSILKTAAIAVCIIAILIGIAVLNSSKRRRRRNFISRNSRRSRYKTK